MFTRTHTKTGGYIALISVLIASALILMVGIGNSMQGIDNMTRSGGEESSFRATLLADSCAEEALMKLRSNFNYTGNETIIVGEDGTCAILAVSGSGNQDRTIRTQASDNGYVRTVQVHIASISPSLVITSWMTVQ